jgi:hypothetical protein
MTSSVLANWQGHYSERIVSRDLYYTCTGSSGGTDYTYFMPITAVGCIRSFPKDLICGIPYNDNASYNTLNPISKVLIRQGDWWIYFLNALIFTLGTTSIIPFPGLIEVFYGQALYDLGFVTEIAPLDHFFGSPIPAAPIDTWYMQKFKTSDMSLPDGWFSTIADAMVVTWIPDGPSPNFFLPEETWVNVEYVTPPPGNIVNRKQEKVQAFPRAGFWGFGDEWYTQPYPQDLPCKLPAGFWATRSQIDSWSEDTDVGNSFATPPPALYQLVFEKPRLWFDLGTNYVTGTTPIGPETPMFQSGWDSTGWEKGTVGGGGNKVYNPSTGYILHNSNTDPKNQTEGMIGRIVGESVNGIRAVTRVFTDMTASSGAHGFMPVAHKRSIIHFYLGENNTPLFLDGPSWEIDSISHMHSSDGHCVGTAVKKHGDLVHYGRIFYKPLFVPTGYMVSHVADPAVEDQSGFGVYMKEETVWDLYCKGSGDMPDGGIVRLAKYNINNGSYSWVNSYYRNNYTTDIYRNLPIVGLNNYKLIRVLPQFSLQSSELVGYQLFRLAGYAKQGSWRVWDGLGIGDTNKHTVIECYKSTYDIEEGKELDAEKAKTPPGAEFTIERKDKEGSADTTIWQVRLPDGIPVRDTDGDVEIEVYLPDFSQLKVIEPTGYYPWLATPVPPFGEVYLLSGQGDSAREVFLIFPPQLQGIRVYIDYQYYDDDLYISHFAECNGTVYACEHGTGRWYEYVPEGAPNYGKAVLVSKVRVGELGLNSKIVNDNNDDLWSITEGSGMLAKFGTAHTMHVEKLNVDGNLPSVLGGLAQAFNAVVDYTPDDQLVFRDRIGTWTNLHILTPDDVYVPTPQHDGNLIYDTIEMGYSQGTVRSGNSKRNTRNTSAAYVNSKSHAQILADMYLDLDKGVNIVVKVWLNKIYKVLDLVQISYPEVGTILAQIIEVGISFEENMATLKLRKRSDL